MPLLTLGGRVIVAAGKSTDGCQCQKSVGGGGCNAPFFAFPCLDPRRRRHVRSSYVGPTRRACGSRLVLPLALRFPLRPACSPPRRQGPGAPGQLAFRGPASPRPTSPHGIARAHEGRLQLSSFASRVPTGPGGALVAIEAVNRGRGVATRPVKMPAASRNASCSACAARDRACAVPSADILEY